jgi:uncharacterized phage-associated protein
MARVTEAHGKRLPRWSQRRKASRRILARWMIYVRQRDALSLQVTSLTRHAEPWNNTTRAMNTFSSTSKAWARHRRHTPNIWLSEQGGEYFLQEEPHEAWKHAGAAPDIMRAFVEHGSQRLTRQLNPVTKKTQISRFFYYSTRGAPGFDSGLLEPATLPKRVVPKHPLRPSHPRSIYGIYAKKTPKS